MNNYDQVEVSDPTPKPQRGFFYGAQRSRWPVKEMGHLRAKMREVRKWMKEGNRKFVRRDIDALIEGLQDLKQQYEEE